MTLDQNLKKESNNCLHQNNKYHTDGLHIGNLELFVSKKYLNNFLCVIENLSHPISFFQFAIHYLTFHLLSNLHESCLLLAFRRRLT